MQGAAGLNLNACRHIATSVILGIRLRIAQEGKCANPKRCKAAREKARRDLHIPTSLCQGRRRAAIIYRAFLGVFIVLDGSMKVTKNSVKVAPSTAPQTSEFNLFFP